MNVAPEIPVYEATTLSPDGLLIRRNLRLSNASLVPNPAANTEGVTVALAVNVVPERLEKRRFWFATPVACV